MGFERGALRSFIAGVVGEILVNIFRKLHHLERIMQQQLDALTTQVAANTSVVQSAVTLIAGLKVSLDAAIAAQAAGDDGAALTALSEQLATSDAALAAAVAANTPAAPAASTAGSGTST